MRRIVSLVPSLTETAAYLGLGELIVGCTDFCTRPNLSPKKVQRIGGTKNPDFSRIVDLKPTDILTNREENSQEDIERAKELATVYECGPISIEDSLRTIEDLASRFDGVMTPEASTMMKKDLVEAREAFAQLKPSHLLSGSLLSLIWNDPLMAAANDTYAASVCELVGERYALNSTDKRESRYPVLSGDELEQLRPCCMILTTEPFYFRKRHAEIITNSLSYDPRMLRFDGRLLTWWGASTIELLEKIKLMYGGVERPDEQRLWVDFT